MGMGYEITPTIYTNCHLEFHNIANIHVMRDSLKKLQKLCSSSSKKDINNDEFKIALANTGWLEHIRRVFQGLFNPF